MQPKKIKKQKQPMSDIIKNPFIIVGDIPEPYFCDREAETQRIIRTITNEGNMVLMSPRRMGKSRLVKHVFKQTQIAEHYQTFYIDLLHTSSIREFAYTFGRTVFDQLKSRSEKMLQSLTLALKSIAGTFGFDPLTGLPTFTLEMGRIQSPNIQYKKLQLGWRNATHLALSVSMNSNASANTPTINKDRLKHCYAE